MTYFLPKNVKQLISILSFREEPEVEEKPKKNRSEAIDRWGHDMFDPNQQGPKSDQELVDMYGYDIRQEEGAPRYINFIFNHYLCSNCMLFVELVVAGVMVVGLTSTIVLGRTKMRIHDRVGVVVLLLEAAHRNEVVRPTEGVTPNEVVHLNVVDLPNVEVHLNAVLEVTAIQMSVHVRNARKYRERMISLHYRNIGMSLNPKGRIRPIALLPTGGMAKEEIWALEGATDAEAAARRTQYLSGEEAAGEHLKSPKSLKEPTTEATACHNLAKEMTIKVLS